MDPIKLLKEDHRTVEELFQRFEKLGDRATKTRGTIVKKICEELTLHTQIEEKLVYPRAKACGGDLEDMTLEAFEEHALAKELIAQLEKMPAEDERFKAKATVLKELIEHHVEEEESDFFPKMKKAMDRETLNALGDEIAAFKARRGKKVPQKRSLLSRASSML